MRNAWAIYKKELRTFFVSPLFWVVAAVFLYLCGHFFWTDLDYFADFGFGVNIVANYWQLLFVDMQRVMLFTIPLLTMRLFAEERKLGTIELLYTYPLRDGEILAGKFAATATVFGVILGATLAYPWYVYSIQEFPLLAIVPGYLGCLLLGVTFIACGLFVSSITDSQVVAGVLSIGLLLLFWVVSWNEAAFDAATLDIVRAVSMFDHFLMFAQGVVDSSAAAYYLLISTFFVVLTLRSMESRRWRGKR